MLTSGDDAVDGDDDGGGEDGVVDGGGDHRARGRNFGPAAAAPTAA